MSTFCRITGKSKGLPKPNYFPLLPPISPADAKRFCRITGKAYGLPTHHYIPVLVGLPARKQTPFSPTQLPHETNGFTSKKRHVMLADYRYVFPCYEESNDLIQLLATKKTESTAHYVYKVAERRCSLVFTAQMEAAVRDGDIRNVMLAKDSDTLLLKLKRGIDVSVDVKEMSIEGLEVYDGEGPSEEVLSKRPKRKKAGGTDLVRKIFEDKEREAEKEFVESESKRPKMMKLSGDNNTTKEKAVTKLMAKFQNVQNFKAEDSKVVTVESSADLKSSLENVDWNKLSTDSAIPSGKPLSSTMPSPLEIHPENVNLGSSLPGIIHQPNYSLENTTGVETTAAVSPLKPLVAKPDDNVQEAIKNMSAEDLDKTSDVNAVFGEDGQKLDLLPRPEEIPEIVNNMKCGVPSVVDRDGKNVHGLKVDIESAQRLVVGVSLETASGSVFMPGQTINTPAGDVFVPGVTVRTPNGPRLIPGQVVDVDDTNGQKTPMFVAGQTLVTRDGEMFVQGQSIETPEGVKFMPGQTVLSENIPKFVPGQVTMDEEGQHRFVAGKTVSTPDGQHFIPGQMHTSATGESLFVPGQSVQTEQGWEFVPGKNMVFEEGEVKFVPGQEIKTAEGQSFVPGQFVNGDGNTTFVPGITTENEQGLKFVPGATVNTPYGQKFVEGQVYKSDSGTLSFVPGVTTAADDGSYTFAAATSLKDVVFRSDMSVGISVESVHMNGDVSDDVIYGHMVQTSQGVEFFPGVASGLPAGKVVPGRLVRGKEVKFVPGLLIDGKFVPGQVVMTDHGEQFIPGQVVETKDGPKFVPGQIIETKAGPKFVPGQTIQTEEGPKFVPGQIVETKAGPTFIPGQIISTDEEGCRFVPGQVVDTAEGPRFVPGRVVETGDRVTFIPGQVVQTSEGLKFVAPDYQDDPEGGVEFTVQGFSITPEELSLLKNRRNSKATISAASGEAAIDSRMMRQLSEAGMSIGRQVPADVPLVDVRTVPAMGIACSLADKLGLDAISTIKLSHILAAVSDLNYEIPIVGQSLENLEEIQLLQSMLKAASRADSEFSLYNEICRFLEKVLARKPDEMIEIIDKFHKFVINSELLAPLRRENKLVTLKDVVQNGTDENAVAKLTSVLSDDQAGLSSAFKHLIDGCPELVDSVVKEVSKTVNELRNEKAAADSLQRAIVNTVRESSEISVQQMLRDVEGFGLQTLLSEAVGLARALGLRDVASTLMAIMNDPNSTKLLEGDRVTLDILRRLTVMRQLAEKRPDFALALRKLQSDPELARSDPFIRELVRESGSLLILPDDAPLLQNSSDVPMSLLQNDNSLAMEDFMLRSQKHGILLIIKHGLQAVVPREAARAVLTGQVPYTVLDETGIHHFAPLHVFSALHLPPISTHRFSMYSIHTEEDAATLTPATSTDDFRKLNNPSVCTNPEQCLSEESGELIFTANQDFIADDMDALTLHRGEQVILLDTGCDPSKRLKLDPDLDLGTDVGSLLDNTAARHKISVRPRRKHADSRQRATLRDERWLVQCCDDVMRQGWVPSYILTSQKSFAEADSPTEAKYQREAVIRELVETEEEFGRDIQQVVDEYLKPLDSSSVPRIVRDNKDLIFNNLKQIADFHNTVLIEGLKYYANEPRMLGKTFLRLERDFDKHVTYCRDEPAAQDFLMENEEARDFFEELSQQLGDDKSLCEHLKLPIQRINDYQLLLKELVKYSKQLGEDTADLGKALELMLAVPHRANDNKFISNIEGYHGNIHKLGRLLRHDWFCVTDRDGKSKERYLFLFKARILICKVRRISEDRFVFVLKDIIRLPEVEVKDHIDDSKVFELHHKQPGYGGYPLTISAHKDKIKDFWLAEIRQYASDVLALAEHAADDLRLQELNEDNRNLELPAGIHIEPATPEQSIPLEPRGDSTAVKTDIFAEFQKKRDARTAKTAEDTKKVSKTSEEKVLTDSEQPLKPDSEQSQQTGNTSSKPSESTPGSEAKKLEQVVESPKPVSEPSKPVSEPPKTISEPLKPVSEPPKAVSEPPKPISEPSKSISEPPKPVTEPSKPVSEPIKPVSESPKPVTEPPKPVNEPSKPISEPPKPASEPTKPASELSKPVSEPPTPVSESLQPTEIKKLVTDLTEPTVKSTETVAELPKLETEPSKPTSEIQKRKNEALKPETEGQKPVSEQPKPTSEPSEPVNKLPKLEAEPSKTATELFKSTPEPQETVTEPPKSISEPPKIETDFQKPVAENPVTEPPKPTADIQKQTTTEPPKVTVEQKPTIETQKPVTPTSTVTKEVEQKPISPQPIDVPIVTEKATKDTLILSKQQLKEEQLELESKQEVVGGVKRKESADSASEKKVKFEEDTEMDGYSSYSSRRSGTRHVEVEEYRSVSSSSSQEVYIETSASRQQLSSGMSTSQNMRLVEESTIINGQLVSHSQEITGGGGGYTKIQELTAGTDDVGGYTTIEEYISGSDANDVKGFASEKESTVAITEVQISDVRRRSSGPKFKKTIEGINIERLVSKPTDTQQRTHSHSELSAGERAVFECHLEDKAKVIWLKNNKPLEDKLADRINSLSCNDTAYRLEILGAHESDAGTYTARAVNETGDASSCSALLLVEKLAEEEKKKREESRIPWFLVRLKDTEVLENTYLRFMVKVKGYKPDVKFYKDDRLITVANERVQINKEQADVGFYELIIPDVLQEDVGIYKCIASNRYGEVECEATVTVTDDKKIFEGLEESDLLKPGEQPNFTWLRDGQPFDPEERFKVLFKDEEDSLALVFQHVKPEDAGLYTCVATTSTGKISCSAELTVQGAVHHLLREPEKPTVSTEIKKVEANINGSAMIELTVDGYPKPEVKWTKDGKEITAGSKYKILYEDEKSMSLLIKNVTIEDAGSYKVEAKNDLGIDSEEITVTVKAPPKIKKKLTDYSGMAGETIKMTVEIEGEPKPNVTWYKDGKVIIKSDHVKTYDESSTSYTLLIEKSTLDDAGSYSVVASNELSQTSEFCKVEVLSPPQFISTMTKNVISKEGETIIYQVKVQGEPKPTVKWFCYGNELKSDGTHIKITEDQQTHTLTVSGVTREDAGKYTCEISNVYGKNSDSSTLNVRCSPQFRQKLTDKVAKEGDTNVEFTVNIEAFPKPNVKWFHNETEITEKTTEYTKIEEGDNYKLIIKEVTTAMSGKYSCKVVNELGSNETSATFAVHSKPKFSKGLKDIQVDEGASLTLQIEVEGTPDPVVKWYKDGDEVTGDAHIKITRDTQRVENYSMTFTLVKSSDAGEYEVRASNEMGTAVTKSIVTVQTKTTMIQEDKIKVQEEKPVQREEEKPKPKKAAKAEVEEVSVQEIKPAEVVKTEEIKITQEAAKIEVEQPQKIVETETLTPKKSVEEEIITVQEKAEVQIEPPKKLETVEKKEKSPKRAIKIEKPEEIIEEPPSLPQKISVKSEEKTPEQASIIEKPEEIIEEPPRLPQKISVKSEEKTPEQASIIEKPEEIIQEPPSLPQKISVKSEENVPEQAKKIEKPDEIIEEVPSLPQKASTKQPETPKTAEINGWDSSKKVTIEDCEDEERDVFIEDMFKSGLPDTFSCMELKAELEDYLYLPNSNAGIVEEVPDGEERIIQIMVSRNVSIVSVSEDESSIKNTPEATSETVFNIKTNENIELQENVKVINKILSNPQQGELLNNDKITINKVEQSQKTANESNNLNASVKLLKSGTDEMCSFDYSKNEAVINNSSPECQKSRFSLDRQENAEPSEHQAEDVGYSFPVSAVLNHSDLSNTEGVKYTASNTLDRKILQSSSSVNGQEDIGDPEIENLLKRIQKQRSVLEEILNKEEERYIEAAPEIISADMNDRTIYESLGTKFEIQAKGVPRPEAKWYKDGEELKSSDHIKITEENDKYRLEITKAKMTDAGNYKCKVVNKMGEKAQSAKLSITAETALREPKIKVPLKDQSVPKNEEATMTTILTADPIPEVRWTHDDKDISETYILSSESKEIEDGLKEVTYTLKIPKGCHQDTGVYQFVAKNKFGTAESSARLDIVFKPEITCFKDVVTVPFSNSEMVANILANPRPDIKWSAGGKAVDIDGEHYVTENDTINEVYKLLINGSSINDENTYIVTASNKIGESSAQARFSVHTEPPSILKGIENHSLKDYEPFEFKIRANGIPKPQIIWLKDREEIQPNFRVNIETSDEGQVSSCLSIPHFSEDDVGKYTVKAVSMAGEAESSAKLRMTQIPPSFLKALPRSAEVGEGEPLELKAKLDGSPIPKVKWFKDGAPLVADDHVKIVNSPDGSIKLQIDSVKPTDCGAYKVIAVNPNGESTGICAVAVTPTPRRPSFSKELSDANVTEGEPLRLEAQVMAFPAPEVKWFKDGHPVRPSPGVSFINSPGGLVGLVVDKMRPEDAGTYTLTVANKLGDISSTAKVGVSVKEKKPQFLSQLMPANVVEGFPAKMEIKVSGHPLPQIAWTLNGKPIVPDGEHIKIVDGPDGSQCLVIDKATPEDAGVYAVVAKNSQGEITSQAPLHVATKGRSDIPQEPPSFPKGLRDTTADEETPLTFSAPFLGNPIPDVVWSKDGVPLQASERVQFTCDGNKVGLEINPSKVSDVGIYSCQLKNPLGETESQAKATVRKIYQKPQFTQRFSDLQQLPTFDAKFFARVTGNPKPEISWYKDGNIIKESPKYRMKRDGDTVCLYVQDCTPEDSGIYRCIASNKEGQDTCDAQLQVVDKIEKPQRKEAPAFLKKIGDCEIFKGMTAKFTACATGYPEPEVEWYKGDEKLYPSERIKMEQEGTGLLRLLISGVDPQIDVGKYRCRIFNPYGEDSCEANILCDILDVKPRKPVGDQYTDYDKFRSTGAPLPLADRPIISRMTDRRLTLSWKPSIPIGPRDPVTYHVEMCELPNGDWFTARTGVRSCACDISNLEPFRDYKFRIRVENKYGISDPSPFAQTYREKLLPDPPKFVPYLPPGIDFRPETSPYFPKDFDIERPPHDGYAQAPRFLHQEHDTQYGVKGHNCNLFWFVYGYPKPKMQYFFNDEPIEMGGRYDSSYTRNGQATLFINKMLDRDVGVYEAVATNEHGEARQRVRLEIAEYPEFIKRPNETIIMIRRSGRLEARVTGVPPPEIKWYKDWQPLAQSSRIKMQHIEPDVYILVINDVILKDEGLYSISARNIAGSISSSVMIRVEENEADYSYHTYDKGRSVKPRTNKTLEDLYDLGDELGRGTQGITYHAVERLSGRNYAAKMMHGKGELRAYMRNELEIMNLLNHRKLIRLHDAFETPDSFMLITELAGGGELLDTLTKQTFTTESEIAGYIRQILLGLEHMHDLNIAHLGLTPGDLLISHAGGDDLKICDFGLARRIAYGKLAALDFGMPEYVAPEIINGEGVSFSADMWAVGIITHLLLTGISIFRSVDDRTTLTNIKEDRWEFNEDIWKNLSSEARDFIRQLVVHQPERRMDVKAALKHPWLTFADKIPSDQYQITTDTLRNYCNLYKDWYSNASCRLWYRRRPLIGAFSHPSRMVYPPGHVYTPEPSPEPRRSKDYSPHIRTWEDRIPSREPIDYELGVVKSESHYQNGPDTYLLQLRDVDFPVRLREYMKVAANRAPGYSRQVSDQHHLDWKAPVIRERRRFTDVMDEEIDDERRARINKYGNADLQTMRRLKHEIGTRLDTHVEADALMEAKRDGHAPFFREKPQILPIVEDQNAQLVCYAVGDPNPTVQWFKNDLVVTESHRLKIIEDDTGRSILSFSPAASFDIGIYKVVARNKIGQVIARTRVVLAQPPDAPDSPDASDISDTEVLLRWKQPKEDGNSPVVCYSLQYKEADTVDWKDVASNIDHEFFVIRGLRPNIAYQFRLSARNKIGWSEKGIPTKPIKTKAEGAPKVQVTKAMKHLQSLCEAGQEIVIEEVKHPLDYSIERNRIEWSNEIPTEKYNFISEIARGRYSVVVKGIDKANDQVIVAKVLDYRPDTEAQVNQEFEVLRSLRHERIAALTHTFKPGNTPVAVFILEKLQGADILTYLSSRHEYTEQMVATVVTQVLDALQYLHWRGYCHLNLEPDNIVMASVRSIQIKLVDFGAAQHVSKLGTMVHVKTNPEYTAPEILSDEPAFPQSDIWSVGVLTYILLSGVSPFKGATKEETKQNITFVRYRFEHLYKELTQEATRFIMLLFKRAPTKRPTVEECHETRWLLPTEFMIKKRERAVFLGNRLKEVSDAYHSEKAQEVTKCDSLVSALGGRAPITRSNSIQEELLTTV